MRAFVLILLLALIDGVFGEFFSGDFTVPTRASHTYASPAFCGTHWRSDVTVLGNVETTLNGSSVKTDAFNWTVTCADPPCHYRFDWRLECAVMPPADSLHAWWVLMPVAFLVGLMLVVCAERNPPAPQKKEMRTPKLLA